MYKKEGIKAPEEVTKYTKDFQKTCDDYSDFVTYSLETTSDKRCVISSIELYREYKMWHSETNVNGRAISKKELITYFEKKFGKNGMVNDFLKGYKLINHERNISDVRNLQNQNENENEDDETTPEIIPEIEIQANNGSNNDTNNGSNNYSNF